MIKDMTAGSPIKLIMTFAVPVLIGNIFQQLYNISDILIVGRLLGVEALAAVGVSAPIFMVLLMIAFGFTGGLTVITAQRFGAKDVSGVRASVVHSLIASTILSLAMTGLTLFYLPQILHLMNVPENIWDNAYRFLFVLCSGLVLVVSYNLLSGFIRALGDSKTPLYFLIFSTVLNALLNLVLVYFTGLGVVGSALGTLTAMTISVVLCVIYIGRKFPILRLRRTDWVYNPAFMCEHLYVAVPMALQFSVIALGLIIIQTVCNSFGSDTIAAFTSALRIEQLATSPLVALGFALATYTAQNFGARKIGRIRRGVVRSSLVSVLFSISVALLVRFVGEDMIGVFIKGEKPEIIDIAKGYLDISTLFYVFLGQIFIFRNTLQGMGQSVIPMAASIVELVMRSFAAVYLASRMGYEGIYFASPIAWVGAAAVVSFGYLKMVRWFRHCLSCRKKHFRSEDADLRSEAETVPAE